MTQKQAEWQRLTDRARWFELPQQSIGIGAVLGLTVAFLGLMIMLVQFLLQFTMVVFWWGLSAFLIGSAGFAYSERSQILRGQWKGRREQLLAARGDSNRCLHLEGELPTHLRDSRKAHCKYFERSFQHAPLCVYCDSYSPEIHPAENPVVHQPESTPTFAA